MEIHALRFYSPERHGQCHKLMLVPSMAVAMNYIPREPGENTSPAMEKTDTRRQSFLPFLAVDYLIDASDSPFVSEVFRNRQWGENTEPKPTMREEFAYKLSWRFVLFGNLMYFPPSYISADGYDETARGFNRRQDFHRYYYRCRRSLYFMRCLIFLAWILMNAGMAFSWLQEMLVTLCPLSISVGSLITQIHGFIGLLHIYAFLLIGLFI
ncbi:hypothetical protein FPQ18DRAFT_307909 [Pyronema domesticum]|nr:hypothetical protein FPQ18DRAFT_307909 [Pyronema domesticum]